MPKLKSLLLLLLCLAIPVQGLAGLRVGTGGCPMAGPDAAIAGDVTEVHDCCHDADTGTGRNCQDGGPCTAAGSWLPVMRGIETAPPTPVTLPPFLSSHPPSFDLSAVWRPPTPY